MRSITSPPPHGDPAPVELTTGPPRTSAPKKRRFKPTRWVIGFLILLGVGYFAWLRLRPTEVAVAPPEQTTMAETIASSGIAQGHQEATVGAQVQGIVTQLYVDEGAVVHAGQLLARVQKNVAIQQVEQASQAVATARAVLAQASARPMPSEIRSAKARVNQAQAVIRQQASLVERARLSRRQAQDNIRQSETQVARAQAAQTQAESRLALARKSLDREIALVRQGAAPQASADEAQTSYDLAVQDVASARQAVSSAKLFVEAAGDAYQASGRDLEAAQSLLTSARAQLDAAQSDAHTLSSRPRSEDVAVAAQRVQEAEAALATASTQARNTDVTAPFDGTVTAILARAGSSPLATGVVRLVQTGRLEIKLDLDETNLRDVRVGQRALIATPSGQYKDVGGHVDRLGSQIDAQRGTLEVFVVTDQPARWLHPGQTLNVNVVTAEKVERLLVPSAAVQRQGDQTLLYVLQDGHAVARPVLLGLLVGDKITVIEGLKRDDQVIQNSYQIADSMRVKAK